MKNIFLYKLVLIVQLFLLVSNLNGQSLEYIVGLNLNSFYEFNSKSGHYSSSYEARAGFSLGIASERIVQSKLFRIAIRLENYSGKIDAKDGGQSGQYNTKAEINKTLFAVAFFPFNLKTENVSLNFGIEPSMRLFEKYKGTNSGSRMTQYGWIEWNDNLEEKYSSFNSPITLGIRTRFAKTNQIGENLQSILFISSYIGLINEFIRFPQTTKSFRISIGLAISREKIMQ